MSAIKVMELRSTHFGADVVSLAFNKQAPPPTPVPLIKSFQLRASTLCMLYILTSPTQSILLPFFLSFPKTERETAETEFTILTQAQLGEATQAPRVTLRHGLEVAMTSSHPVLEGIELLNVEHRSWRLCCSCARRT